MFFLLVMEVLNSLIRRANEWSLLPRLSMNLVPFRATIYVDDQIMFVALSGRDLSMVKTIFDIFEGASGLGCNLAKCQVGPIRCNEDQVQAAVTPYVSNPHDYVNHMFKRP
jgi:hypothetical protein